MQSLRLIKNAERRIHAGHLWIFSNDIDTQHQSLKKYQPGELVCIETAFGKKIALGYINPHCLLCVRILTNDIHEKVDTDFFVHKIQIAQSKRELIFEKPFYRVVFGESDYLPGVVIDQFNEIIVVQINTAGMEAFKNFLLDAVEYVLKPKTIILKCDSTERTIENLNHTVEITKGELSETISVEENHCQFQVPILSGQKTGWFYDQRDNRQKIASFCQEKRVLDVFSYLGGFSLSCAKQGAREVIAIDRSAMALNFLKKNAALNHFKQIHTHQGDALDLLLQLQQQFEKFDVIILDPPALIKRKKDIVAGSKLYQKYNEAALLLLNPNGVLFSASCSMHLSAADLLNCIRRAAIHAKREISVLTQCHQAADHPVHPAIAETNYLKGFIVII